jgi:dTDP-4-dehydrorhamnose reductase
MKILITGGRGMLASDLVRELEPAHEVTAPGHRELDVTDARACAALIDAVRPDVVINAAALTNVDACETAETEAFAVNGHGAGNLAAACGPRGVALVHYSTDYVFDGTKRAPYVEEDPPNPRGVYARSKLLGEQLVQERAPEHLVLRISWVFGARGRNFIKTIVGAARAQPRLRVVDDQHGSPSYTRDLAAHTRVLVESGRRGIYHLTNQGSCSWYELAARAVEWARLSGVEVVPVTTSEFPRPAPRPANSVLANARLAREGFPLLRPWWEAAREYVERELLSPA